MKTIRYKLFLQKSVCAVISSAMILSMLTVNVHAEEFLDNDLKDVEQLISEKKFEIESRRESEKSGRYADEEDLEAIEEGNGENTEGENAEGENTEAMPEEPKEPIVYETVEIKNLEDFRAFAKNCEIDSWSENKNVQLKADIDLAEEVIMIPYFDGIFDGNSHVIKGYSSGDSTYITGLFRYVGISATIENLRLTGNIAMSDDQKATGGICGNNCGVISNCSFVGRLDGNNIVGGIAAINENTGIISRCVNDAHVTGYFYTGGIAGKNYGVISGCINNGNINDNEQWVVNDDERVDSLIGAISTIENDDISSLKEIKSGMDTGGISGISRGSIIKCTNNAVVGYEHVGYNVGGIVGRQTGMVSYCENNGNIFGRKDIGGIVGQMEPHLEQEDLRTLPEAADELHELVNKTIEDLDGGVDDISEDIDDLTVYADNVVDDGRSLTGEITDTVNADVEVFNAMIERIEYVLDCMPGILDDVSGAMDSLYYFNESAARIIEDMDMDGEMTDSDRQAVTTNEDSMYNRYSKAIANTERIAELIQSIDSILYETDAAGNKQARAVTVDELKQVMAYLAELEQIAGNSGGDVMGMMGDLSNIIEIYKPYEESSSDNALGEKDNALKAIQDTTTRLRRAAQNTKSIINYLNAQSDLRLRGFSSTWDNSLESLHNNLKGIGGSIKNINSNGRNTSHTLNSNLRAINDQVNVIYHLISDKLDILQNDEIETITDVSDEDIENAKDGRVDISTNKGTIRGDINVGGIAGAMAIDKDDPEENAAGDVTKIQGKKYTLKNIITSCKNDSDVQSKKDGAGLIVGYMAQGVVSGCEGYGVVKSTEGNYTGGIAGESFSIIRNCYSICLIGGSKYVGGITGYGTTITDCVAMTTWENIPLERYGTIAGLVNENEDTFMSNMRNITGNKYVKGSIDGIDNISYAGKAEPIDYKNLVSVYGTPGEFSHLKVVYEVEGEKVGEQELSYGESFENLQFPQGEYRENYYVKWPDISERTMDGTYIVTGEYVPTVKAVDSEALYTNTGKPLAILGGNFGKDASIKAQLTHEPKYVIADKIAEQDAVVYKITADTGINSQGNEQKIRLYNPYGKYAVVKEYNEGKWKKLKSKQIGSYVELALKNNDSYYAVISSRNMLKLGIYIGIVVVAVLTFFILINTVGRVPRAKTKKKKTVKKRK